MLTYLGNFVIINLQFLIIFIVAFFSATTTKHVSIQSPSNDISPMSVISGVKSSPRKEKSSLSKKGEKLPRFGVKTEQEPELSTVRKACCCCYTPLRNELICPNNVGLALGSNEFQLI